MTGIQFLTDEKGRRTAAVIDLKVHRALWETCRMYWCPNPAKAKRHTAREVKADLIKCGKLHE
jgi:hypothetical protein